jgi:hypothetical protein
VTERQGLVERRRGPLKDKEKKNGQEGSRRGQECNKEKDEAIPR